MKAYISPQIAEVMQSNGNCLTYPHVEKVREQYPFLGKTFLPTEGHEQYCTDPDALVVEALHYLGAGPKKILDFGCGAGKNALYLAANGFNVVAVDTDKDALGHTQERARNFAIPKGRLEVRHGGIDAVNSWEKFDAVVATMVFHYMNEPEQQATMHKLQGVTTRYGIQVVSAYTMDNPVEEAEASERQLFGPGRLSGMFSAGWHKQRDVEGISPTPVQRGDSKLLLPSVAEVIAINNSYTSTRMVLR
jgi:SAM-dependent methyltransferase